MRDNFSSGIVNGGLEVQRSKWRSRSATPLVESRSYRALGAEMTREISGSDSRFIEELEMKLNVFNIR